MAFECNIDARGKAARFRMGMLGIVGGTALGFATLIGILPTTIGYMMAGGSIGEVSLQCGKPEWAGA